MKKTFFSFFVVLVVLTTNGCSTTTITEMPGNYLYGMNEPIKVIDIDTRNKLGTITITGAEILLDHEFVAEKKTGGRDDAGEQIYKKVTCHQIVQFFFQHDLEKIVDKSNFIVRDDVSGAGIGIDNMKGLPEFEEKVKHENKSFIVVLEKKSAFIEMDFKYSSMQVKPTAKIKITLE